jgi:hypothetical protein
MTPAAVRLLADPRRQLLTPSHRDQEVGSDAVQAA